MFCLPLSLSLPSKGYFSICIVAHYTPLRPLHGHTQTLTHPNCIQKITSLPCRLKITSVLHHPTNHSPGLLFFPSPLPLSPALLHYFSLFPPLKLGPKLPGLNCPMNSVGWTGRQEVCVNAWVSLLSPSLFIFLSKWCCQEPNKISLSALPRQGVYTQHLGKEIKEWKKKKKKKGKVNKMVAFWLCHLYRSR